MILKIDNTLAIFSYQCGILAPNIKESNIRFSGYDIRLWVAVHVIVDLQMELEEALPLIVTWLFSFMQNIVFALFIIVTVGLLRNEGGTAYLKRLWSVFILIPGIKDLISMLIRRQVKSFITETADKMGANFIHGKKTLEIPEKGISIIHTCK